MEYEFNEEDETKEYNGLDKDTLERLLYGERNRVFGLYNKFKKEELGTWNLNKLYYQLGFLDRHYEKVHAINEKYSELVGESSSFYNQYEKLVGEIYEMLESAIENKKMDGDYR